MSLLERKVKPSIRTSPAQAWAILLRHAREEINPLRLQELCSDVDRVNSLVTVHNTTYCSQETSSSVGADTNDNGRLSNRILLADLSRQKMNLETLNHLLRLAHSRDIKGFIRKLAWAQNDPDNPMSNRRRLKSKNIKNLPCLLALRAPSNKNLSMISGIENKDVLIDIHAEWNRIERLSNRLRKRGQIHDVIVVGRGVIMASLQFVYDALKHDYYAEKETLLDVIWDEKRKSRNQRLRRRMKFISSLDPVAISNVLSDLKPEHSVVVSISMFGDEENDQTTMQVLENWLCYGISISGSKKSESVHDHILALACCTNIPNVAKPEHTLIIP